MNFNFSASSELKSSPKPYRPFTAMMATKTAPEEPIITSKGAWTGSTLVFHYKTNEIKN